MPDILSVIVRRWKLMASLTLAATALAFFVCLISPKKYMSVATALAANPALSDKARIFNQNIEGLYTALGSPDELDKVEGTAKLDTIYIALAKEFSLAAHYKIDKQDTLALYKAAARLKKSTTVSRSGYGELRIKVWDENNQMAATLANAAMQKLNDIHQRVQTENNRVILQRLREDYAQKQQALQNTNQTNTNINRLGKLPSTALESGDDSMPQPNKSMMDATMNASLVTEQLAQYARLINEYELTLKTAPNILLVVENARPSPRPEKPDTTQTVALSFLGALLFSFLLALFLESRNQKT